MNCVIGYAKYRQPHLDLFFEVTRFGASRIAVLPEGVVTSSQNFPYVDEVLKHYRKAIEQIGQEISLEIPKDPLESCLKFSAYIVQKNFHLSKELSLKGKRLTILPPQVALFKNLTHLDLSQNSLKRLFAELPLLETLEELDISDNEGIELPDLQKLPNLRVLKANGCGWVSIPPWIEKSQSLKKIELQRNNIEILPDQMTKEYLLDERLSLFNLVQL